MASQVVSIYAINLVSDNNMFDKESKQIEKKNKIKMHFHFRNIEKNKLKMFIKSGKFK